MADEKVYLSTVDVMILAERAASRVIVPFVGEPVVSLYSIPRGGVPAALAIATFLVKRNVRVNFTTDPKLADYLVDDLIDSGHTMEKALDDACPLHGGPKGAPLVLIDKSDPDSPYAGKWIVFPWEVAADGSAETAEENVRRLLQAIGEDADREGLLETPARFVKAFREKTQGYAITDPGSLLKTFEDGNSDELVVVKGITFDSLCEHHLERISGTASIAYIPAGRIVGLSKFVRVVDAFAHRLQVQERLTTQIADCIQGALEPKGVAVVIDARHGCMECRGVRRHGVETITSALRGCFRDEPAARAEVMGLLTRA